MLFTVALELCFQDSFFYDGERTRQSLTYSCRPFVGLSAAALDRERVFSIATYTRQQQH